MRSNGRNSSEITRRNEFSPSCLPSFPSSPHFVIRLIIGGRICRNYECVHDELWGSPRQRSLPRSVDDSNDRNRDNEMNSKTNFEIKITINLIVDRYRFVVLNKTTQLLTISMINNFSKSKKTWNSRSLAWIYRRKASGRGFHNNSSPHFPRYLGDNSTVSSRRIEVQRSLSVLIPITSGSCRHLLKLFEWITMYRIYARDFLPPGVNASQSSDHRRRCLFPLEVDSVDEVNSTMRYHLARTLNRILRKFGRNFFYFLDSFCRCIRFYIYSKLKFFSVITRI